MNDSESMHNKPDLSAARNTAAAIIAVDLTQDSALQLLTGVRLAKK